MFLAQLLAFVAAAKYLCRQWKELIDRKVTFGDVLFLPLRQGREPRAFRLFSLTGWWYALGHRAFLFWFHGAKIIRACAKVLHIEKNFKKNFSPLSPFSQIRSREWPQKCVRKDISRLMSATDSLHPGAEGRTGGSTVSVKIRNRY